MKKNKKEELQNKLVEAPKEEQELRMEEKGLELK